MRSALEKFLIVIVFCLLLLFAILLILAMQDEGEWREYPCPDCVLMGFVREKSFLNKARE